MAFTTFTTLIPYFYFIFQNEVKIKIKLYAVFNFSCRICFQDNRILEEKSM
jgi:hypothetical protein